ncbi:MAG: hypothetical protein A07HB70_02479 [uncultured archaeon A07HB70]|nr:MAG: hypothetical protein A07HB70_02479 [uncultured archaeon A07HB70]
MASQRGYQNAVALLHIGLGVATLVGGPVVAGLAVWAFAQFGVTVPATLVIVRVLPAMIAGLGLALAGHLASAVVQERWAEAIPLHWPQLLVAGWLVWLGFVSLAIGPPVAD